MTDIDAFVAAVSAAGGTTSTAPISVPETITVRMPRADLAGPWQMRRAEVAP
jgi:hypothetical protein